MMNKPTYDKKQLRKDEIELLALYNLCNSAGKKYALHLVDMVSNTWKYRKDGLFKIVK